MNVAHKQHLLEKLNNPLKGGIQKYYVVMCPSLPNIYYFNPTCEMAIANGTVSWQPNKLLQQFETDIELVTAFLASPTDILLMRKLPSKEHIQKLQDSGIKLPTLLQYEEAISDSDFINRPKGTLNPWGWSPVMHRLFNPIIESCSDKFLTSPHSKWNPELKELFSRKTALNILSYITEQNISGIIPNNALPQICTSIDAIKKFHTPNKKLVLKAPWSSSGRGVQIIDQYPLHPYYIAWSQSILKEQGYIMVEAFHNILLEFAFQFKISKNKIKYLGTSWFSTNEKGDYKGNYLHNNIAPIPDNLKKTFNLLELKLVQLLSNEIEKTFVGKYEGIIGFDSMFIQNNDGETLIHPCSEINLRYNMGNVATSLSGFSQKNFSMFKIASIEEFKSISSSKKLLLTEGKNFCAFLI